MRGLAASLFVFAAACSHPPSPTSGLHPPDVVGAPPVPGDVRSREAYQLPQDSLPPTQTTPARRLESETVPPPSVAATTELPDDGKIITIARIAVASSREQAKLAEKKAIDPRVRALAHSIDREGLKTQEVELRMLRDSGLAGGTSEAAERLEADGHRTYDHLAATGGSSFDQAYLEAQVRSSKALLQLIDAQLLPGATSDAVQTIVRSMRPETERRWDRTRSLIPKLDK